MMPEHNPVGKTTVIWEKPKTIKKSDGSNITIQIGFRSDGMVLWKQTNTEKNNFLKNFRNLF